MRGVGRNGRDAFRTMYNMRPTEINDDAKSSSSMCTVEVSEAERNLAKLITSAVAR